MASVKKISAILTGAGVRHFIGRYDQSGNPGHWQMRNCLRVKHHGSLRVLLAALESHLAFKRPLAQEALAVVNERLVKRRPISSVPPAGAAGRPWTQEDVEALRRMDSEGYGNPAIAEALGRSWHSVAQKKHRLKGET